MKIRDDQRSGFSIAKWYGSGKEHQWNLQICAFLVGFEIDLGVLTEKEFSMHLYNREAIRTARGHVLSDSSILTPRKSEYSELSKCFLVTISRD